MHLLSAKLELFKKEMYFSSFPVRNYSSPLIHHLLQFLAIARVVDNRKFDACSWPLFCTTMGSHSVILRSSYKDVVGNPKLGQVA